MDNEKDNPINWEQLKQLEELGSHELVEKLIEIFQHQGKETLDQLSLDYLKEDYKSFKQNIHKLKSSSLNIGAMLLSKQCEFLEEQKNHVFNQNKPQLDELKQTFNLTIDSLCKLSVKV